MEFVVDVQGFKTSWNEFIVKELAIVPLGEDVQPVVYLFKPPHDWNFLGARYKCENNWLYRNYHGLDWKDGEIPYDELNNVLKSAVRGAKKIYVKGLEKVRWLENIIPKVCNIEALGCPSLATLYKKDKKPCSNHNLDICREPHCAARNVIAVKTWFLHCYIAPTYSFYEEVKQS